MRFTAILLSAGLILLLLGCMNSNKSDASSSSDASSASDASEIVELLPDTTVYSLPLEYGTMLENLDDSSRVEIASYKEVLQLFEEFNFTPESWQAGIREIPRIYLTIIGDRWGSQTTKEITVLDKKRLFFRGIAPLILRSNELILKDRERLEGIRSSRNDSLAGVDRIWIERLATLYKVELESDQPSGAELEELWTRVDAVPPSLALAQSAEESGWGTSRFAAQGNALYGQWTWGKNAIVPEQQRKELGNYGIASFNSLQESISAYMLNLNTHRAYAELRHRRAELRKNGEQVTGVLLAETLTKYSERGEAYVETLKEMMEYNRLSPVDDAYLPDMDAIYLFSVETPSAE